MRVNLERININNYLCFGEGVEIPLENQGLVLVLGEVIGAPFASSNTAGKSSFLDAIMEGAFGRNSRGVRGAKNVIRWGEEECSIDLQVNGKIIRREYTSKGKNLVYLDGAESTQEKVEAFLQCNFQQFLNYSMFADSTTKKSETLFASGTPQERFGMLKDIIDLEIWDSSLDNAKGELERLQSEYALLYSEVEKCSQEAELCRNQRYSWESRKKSFQEQLNKLDNEDIQNEAEFEEECQNILEEITGSENAIKTIDGLQRSALTLEQEVEEKKADALKAVKGWEDTLQRYKIESGKLSSKIGFEEEVLSEEKCSRCGQNITGEHDFIEELNLLHKEQLLLQDKITEADSGFQQWTTEYKNLCSEQRAFENERMQRMSEKRVLQGKVDNLKSNLYNKKQERTKQFEQMERISKDLTAELEKAEAGIEECTKKEAALLNEYNQSTDKLGELQEEIRYIKAWVGGFSPSGCPSLRLQAILPEINNQLQKYLPRVLSEKYNLHVSGMKRNSKGELQNKVSLVLDGVFDGKSQSERKRIELAIQWALADLIRGSNCRFYDEVVNSLDARGVSLVLELLKEMLDDSCRTIFVISHQDIGYAFDRKLIFRKQNGITKVA